MPKRNNLLSTSTALAAIVALVALFAGCAKTVAPEVVKVTIQGGDFTMDMGATKKLTADVSVLGGAATTVKWTSDTTSVATVANDGTVTAKAVGKAKITATSTVDKTKSATVTVTVQPASPPTINSFTATPSSLDEGATTTLSWDVSGASTYSLSDGSHSISITQTATGSVTVLPTTTGTVTYTLTANNVKGNTTATATVTVQAASAAPVVTSFTAAPATVTEGTQTPSTLSWVTTGAVSWSLSDGTNSIDVPQKASGSVDVTPTTTTTYTLTATNSQGDTTATATVTVQPAPTVPTINSFTASPTGIDQGGTTTLSWDVTGATSLSLSDGTNPITIAQTDTGTVDVTPTQTGTITYTLTATNSQGNVTATADVTVTPVPAPTVSNLQATTATGSTVDLSWQATDATSFDIYAVLNTDNTDQQLVQSGVTGTTATIDIPVSTRQTIRVVAHGGGGTAHADVTLTNVVTSSADYDPYPLQGHTPDTPIPGTLRYEIANAAPGSVVGFASDVTSIDVSGVDILSGSGADSHLIFRGDVTVSAPSAGVTLTAVSPAPSGSTPAEAFTWQSRVMLVAPGVTVQLDNLTIQGGTFIYNGAGIYNEGDLTLNGTTVTGNRAWELGGGIYNASSGTLTLADSHVDGNRAVTLDSEMGTNFPIRGDPTSVTTPSDGGYGGGLFNDGGTVTVTNTTFDGNEAKFSGGGIYNPSGSVTMTNSPIANNTADYNSYTHSASDFAYGGGAYNAGTFSFTGADITGNTVADLGGGFALATSGTATLSQVNFDGNSATWGGAIEHYYCTDPSNLTTTDVTFGTNTATGGNDNIDANDTCAPVTTQIGTTHPAMEMIPGMKTQPQR